MTSTALTVQQGGAVSIRDGFTEEQISLVKTTIMPGASTSELELFLMQCKRTGLDPFMKQIYSISRSTKQKDGSYKDVFQTQISIDGFRVIAERSGEYCGQTIPLFCGDDGIWKDVWLESKPPRACKLGIYRKGFSEPLYRVALWENYAQLNYKGELAPMWKKMPANQLAKCCEALGLRAAFPNDLGGLHTPDEAAAVAYVNNVEDSETGEITKPTPNKGIDSLLDRLPPDQDTVDTTSAPLSVTENAQTTEQAETPEPAPEERITSIKNKLTELKWTKQVVIDTLGVYKVPGLWTHDDCDKLKHWCDAHEVLSSADSATGEIVDTVSTSVESAPVSETVLTAGGSLTYLPSSSAMAVHSIT